MRRGGGRRGRKLVSRGFFVSSLVFNRSTSHHHHHETKKKKTSTPKLTALGQLVLRGGLLQQLGSVLILVPAKERERGEALVGLFHKVQGASCGTVRRHRFFFLVGGFSFFLPFVLLALSRASFSSQVLLFCAGAVGATKERARDAEKRAGKGGSVQLSRKKQRKERGEKRVEEESDGFACFAKVTLSALSPALRIHNQSIRNEQKEPEHSPSPFPCFSPLRNPPVVAEIHCSLRTR